MINRIKYKPGTQIDNSFYKNILPKCVPNKRINIYNIEKYYVVNLVIPTDLAILL